MPDAHGPYSHLPEGVQRRIIAGQVPPPRKPSDPPDAIRDLKLAVAIAEDEGDQSKLARLNAQWIEAERRGEVSTWKAETTAQRRTAEPSTREELHKAARDAEGKGDHDRAHAYRVKAMHAPEADVAKLVTEANEATDPTEGGRLRIEALRALRGEPEPLPRPVERAPQTAQELNAAIAEAEAEGDHATANRHRAGLLVLARQQQDGGMYDLAASQTS